MGKPTGFIEHDRVGAPSRDPASRVRDWQEVYEARSLAVVGEQAGRCMDCGVPFCQQGCPLGNLIPDWNHDVYKSDWQRAYRQLAATNNFPELTGRLCPAPCEAACTLAIGSPSAGGAVTIEQIELEIIERAFSEGWVEARRPRSETGKRVAVVGSGPAGLAAAEMLRASGHAVTVYEKADRIGGLLRYGIPDFKMEKWVLDRRLELLAAAGIEFVTSADVGVSPRWDELARANDAVLIATGSRRPRDLAVPGRDGAGVVFAMDYLTRQNRLGSGDADADPALDAAGKRVIILGGGDTGSDCLGTAHRQGAAEVMQVELMPTPPTSRTDDNGWPKWPHIFRTSSSQAEGGAREFAFRTTEIERGGSVESGSGSVSALVGTRTDSGETVRFAADLVILAMGFVGPETGEIGAQLGVALDERANIATDRRFATNVASVYAAGDAQRGQSLIVWAISEGREAARSIDEALRRASSRLPSRGRDQPWPG